MLKKKRRREWRLTKNQSLDLEEGEAIQRRDLKLVLGLEVGSLVNEESGDGFMDILTGDHQRS